VQEGLDGTSCRAWGCGCLGQLWRHEVDCLRCAHAGFLDDRVVELYNLGIRVMFIGQRDRLPTSLLERMQRWLVALLQHACCARSGSQLDWSAA
jgi:hypothetical protein